MKILVVSQYYYPEPFRITDICETLVKKGHEVTVVTGIPNYPMGRIYDGYRGRDKRHEVINGVKVYRCFTIGRRTGALWRFLNYYSFSLSSTAFLSKHKEEYDVVFVNQLSPVIMSNGAIRYKKKHGKKMVLYCLDLWPASLLVGGIKENSLLYRYFYKVSKRIYEKADKILITSKSFAKYFEEKFGIVGTEYLPQYAEELFTMENCKKRPSETVDLMFAGNVGAAQAVDTIVRAAALTKDVEKMRWHIVGDGSELEACKRLAMELNVTSVIFHGRQPLEKMPEYYSMADAMLVTMNKDTVAEMTLPGKVQTYMAAGKPIIGAIDGEAARVISESNSGLCCGAEDFAGLAEAARHFACNISNADKHAENSYAYYVNMFEKNKVLLEFERQLQ